MPPLDHPYLITAAASSFLCCLAFAALCLIAHRDERTLRRILSRDREFTDQSRDREGASTTILTPELTAEIKRNIEARTRALLEQSAIRNPHSAIPDQFASGASDATRPTVSADIKHSAPDASPSLPSSAQIVPLSTEVKAAIEHGLKHGPAAAWVPQASAAFAHNPQSAIRNQQ